MSHFFRAFSDWGRKVGILLTPPCRYEHADGLVGVYREQVENSSRTLTLDLAKVSCTSGHGTDEQYE